MEKKDNTPLWVFLAFSSINTRKGALILIWSCIIFSLYCIPWSLFFSDQEWVARIFLIDDWSWLAMMIPIVIWYWLSLRWVDKNTAWDD
ncbi:MAG: hypothetical protein L3J59_00145 [Methylococcaceae bacterium]|nr:hypothetical protein [Methylococcaceae bacterium]